MKDFKGKNTSVSHSVGFSPVQGAASPKASEHLCRLKPGDFIYLAELGACVSAAFLCAGRIFFSATGEREMFLKIEKCNHKTHNIRTYVTIHLAVDCLKLTRTQVDLAVFTFK